MGSESPLGEGSKRKRGGAEEFPLMIVVSIIYPCNLGCPSCPYSDANSTIRSFYREQGGDTFPIELWNRIAKEAGPHRAFLRCTGGGEPMMHPQMCDMVEFAKQQGARVWINTNGSRFGPDSRGRKRLDRIVAAGTDVLEFSMDAGDAETYARLRPPIGGRPADPKMWFDGQVDNIRAALRRRRELGTSNRIVVSIIRQEGIGDRLDDYVAFYRDEIGVDEVITRKFLSWDDNTSIDLGDALDAHLYEDLPTERKDPCVWPFERLNIDTLGRVALCGQDLTFKTAELFPNAMDASIAEIWHSEKFNWYRRMHLQGRGAECFPCRGCSAWLAGVRDWDYGWLQVLESSGHRMREASVHTAEADGSQVASEEPPLSESSAR